MDGVKGASECTAVFAGSYEDVEENRVIEIPEGIVEIAENAFRDFENLESVRLPRSLRRISACAFSRTSRGSIDGPAEKL